MFHNYDNQNSSSRMTGFFNTEIGRQWLDACFEIFDYCVRSLIHYFGNKTSLNQWKTQSRKIQNWNNVFILRWMEQVVMPKFGHVTVFWKKDKDSPLLVEYVYSTFESLTGTVSVQIPALKDFLFCAFSVFLQKLIEKSETRDQKVTLEQLNDYNNQILFTLKNDGHTIALDAVRISFLRVVNPGIRVDTRPTNESISVIMNIRDEQGKANNDQHSIDKSIQINPKHQGRTGENKRIAEFMEAAQKRSYVSSSKNRDKDHSGDHERKSKSKSKSGSKIDQKSDFNTKSKSKSKSKSSISSNSFTNF